MITLVKCTSGEKRFTQGADRVKTEKTVTVVNQSLDCTHASCEDYGARYLALPQRFQPLLGQRPLGLAIRPSRAQHTHQSGVPISTTSRAGFGRPDDTGQPRRPRPVHDGQLTAIGKHPQPN